MKLRKRPTLPKQQAVPLPQAQVPAETALWTSLFLCSIAGSIADFTNTQVVAAWGVEIALCIVFAIAFIRRFANKQPWKMAAFGYILAAWTVASLMWHG